MKLLPFEIPQAPILHQPPIGSKIDLLRHNRAQLNHLLRHQKLNSCNKSRNRLSILTIMAQDSKFKIWYLFIALLLLVGACKPKEEIVLRNVRDIVIDANTEPTLRAQAILYNPNNIRIKLRSAEIDVYVN